MIHYMKLNDRPFNLIKKKYKIFELRLFDEKRSKIQIGDYIEFNNRNDNNKQILVEVVNIHKFTNFEELYNSIPKDKLGYLSSEVINASSLDMLEYYPLDKQDLYGVIAIEIKFIK